MTSSSGVRKPTSTSNRELLENPTFALSRPEISLRRIRKIYTYEVIESDLEDLDKSMQEENQSLAFTSLCTGALISTVISWIGADALSPYGLAAYMSMTVILTLGAAFFGVTWLRGKSSKKGLLERIRTQTLVTEEEKWGGGT